MKFTFIFSRWLWKCYC